MSGRQASWGMRIVLGAGLAACAGKTPKPVSQVEAAPQGKSMGVASQNTTAAPTHDAGAGHPPVPVPQPAIARSQLHPTLQKVWLDVEAAVAQRPPAPPEQTDEASLRQWAEGPFKRWLALRQQAVSTVEVDADWLVHAEVHDKVVAYTLLGYLYEDTAAAIAGAPVPASLAADAELLAIYQETLQTMLQPLARRSARAYATCLRARYPVQVAEDIEAEALAADPWRGWMLYCDEHGQAVVEQYKLR